MWPSEAIEGDVGGLLGCARLRRGVAWELVDQVHEDEAED